MNKKLLKHVFALYSLPVIFSKNFSLARLHFILNLQIQACNVFYQLHLYIFSFLVSLSLTDSFQSSLKKRIKLHKIAYKMSKNYLRGWGWCGVRGGGKGGRCENGGGKSAMVVGGIDALGCSGLVLMSLTAACHVTGSYPHGQLRVYL